MTGFEQEAIEHVAQHAVLAGAKQHLLNTMKMLIQHCGVKARDPAVVSLLQAISRVIEIDVRACAAMGAWLAAAAAELGEERFAKRAGAALPWDLVTTRALMALARDEELQALIGREGPWWPDDASEDLQDRCQAAAVGVATGVARALGAPGGEPTQ